MDLKNKLLIYLIIFAIFDLIIPFPITAVILMYVLFEKPGWFKDYVIEIYNIGQAN